MTPIQVAALKYLIFKSWDASDPLKKLLAWLIDQSDGLQKEVCVTLFEDASGFTADEIEAMARDLDRLHSSNGRTFLNECMTLSGSGFTFSFHYGDFDPNRESEDKFNSDGQFEGWRLPQVTSPRKLVRSMPLRYTFWLAHENYSGSADLVTPTREAIDAINLKKPGLYPALEQ